MTSKAITDKPPEQPDGAPPSGPLAPVQIVGPSEVREDEPSLPRSVGMVGAAFVIFGGMALFFHLSGRAVRVGAGWSSMILIAGMCGLLFHAALDRDVQFRRLYGGFAGLAILLGAILALYPTTIELEEGGEKMVVGRYFKWAVPCLFVALLFLLAFFRHEDEPFYRDLGHYALGGAGVIMAAVGLFGGALRGEFLLSHGFALGVLGVLYLAAFVGSRGISDDRAYYAAVGMAGVGLVVLVVSLALALFRKDGAADFTNYGAILFLLGTIYLLVGAGMASESPLAVLTRRELGSFFYSPLAYLTLFGFILIAWLSYVVFLLQFGSSEVPRRMEEPVIRHFFLELLPVFTAIVVVPVLTMRLLSEEHRSGTLEVLLTAPVNEAVVVFSKFLAALITYLVMWLPFCLYLAAIPLLGGNPFDHRPLLSFGIAQLATGAAFIAAGLFFSSLTRSQVASGVLTGAFMLCLFAVYYAVILTNDSAWRTVMRHMSYIHLWIESMDGNFKLKYILFFLSLSVFFQFLTVKVLESRKWR